LEILISGGNGFLGRHLIGELQKRGHHLRVLALDAEDTSWLEERNVAVFRADIVNPDTLTAPFRGVQSVFHLAAMIGTWRPMGDYYATNVIGTENVCRAALNAGASRVIHISSAMVYNMASDRPVTEDDRLTPLDEPYSLSKARGDMLVQAMVRDERLPAVILRPGTLIGAGDNLNFGRMADRICAGRGIIIGPGRNAIPLFDVTDMVRGLLLALDSQQAVGETYNIGSDQPLNQAEYLSLIAQELAVAEPRRHVPYAALYSAAYCAERLAAITRNRVRPFLTRHGVKLYGADNLLSIEKARGELGYEPRVPVADAVCTACKWYRERGRDTGRLDDQQRSVKEGS
jgi:nucleoside-diphosphate-sugar epimerase